MKLEKLIKILEIIGALIGSAIVIVENVGKIKSNLGDLKLLSKEEEEEELDT